MLNEGFRANSIVPQEFDYRQVANRVGRAEMNTRLIDAAKGYDLVFIGKGELIDRATLASIRKAGSLVAIWYGDMRPKPPSWLIENLHECDLFFMTTAGEVLKKIFQSGKPGKAAFFLNPANPALVEKFDHIQRSVDPPLFTATIHPYIGEERKTIYQYLCRRGDVQIIGSPDKYFRSRFLQKLYLRFRPIRYVRGEKYVESIIRSRFGIGVSAFQGKKYYTSDRLSHYLTFGKLYLAYRFPGCEDLFENGKHIVFYEGVQDLELKIEYYLHNKEIAEEIGRQGQNKMITDYNTQRMVRMMLDIINTGYSHMFPWVEIYS